jgi:hypothetical protein
VTAPAHPCDHRRDLSGQFPHGLLVTRGQCWSAALGSNGTLDTYEVPVTCRSGAERTDTKLK